MSRQTSKDIFAELGIDRQLYNQLAGINTRGRSMVNINSRSLSNQKSQEKKKPNVKKQAYVPPTIMQNPVAKVIDYEWFKGCVEDLLKYMKTNEANFMSIELMYQIYKEAAQKGGIVQVSSINGFTPLARNIFMMAGPTHVFQEFTSQFIEKIRQLLFSVQFINRNQGQRKVYQLGLINFVSKQELKQNKKDKDWGLNYFNFDLTLFQEGAQGINVDSQIFNLDYMCKHYGNQKIDIRIQNPLDYGFKPSKLKNKKYEMLLKDYRFYQLNFLDVEKMNSFKHTDQLGKGQVFFGVNFQPEDQMLNKQIKKNVSGTFLDFHGDFDLMSYLDADVPGCSLPQMYFKTPGCWTGGHQQNVCMSALNINHGPSYSEWFTLQLKQVDRLRKQLIQNFGTDLYSAEGLWYQKLDWFIQRGYPVKRFLQRTDDIVVTGPGTLHWVRSFGVAIQTSWNIFPKNYQQFQAAFFRHKINFQTQFHKSDTVPLKSLVLKYLNHQRSIMSQKNRLLCIKQIQEWFQQQNKILANYYNKIERRQYFYLKDLESFCALCKQEVLAYFVAAPANLQRGISCLNCFQKNKSNQKIQTLYFKLDIFFLELLIYICNNQKLNKQNTYEIQQLCKGFHVGDLPIKCKVMQRAIQQRNIKQNFLIGQQNAISSAGRQIFYNDTNKFEFYETYFKQNGQPNKLKTSQLRFKDKLKLQPHQKISKVMEIIPEEGEMIDQKAGQVQKIDVQCQTQNAVENTKKQTAEEGEISSDSSKQKKKKKHKSKSKKKKTKKIKKSQKSQQQSQRQQSPRFMTSQEQQECKAKNSTQKQISNFGSNNHRDRNWNNNRDNNRQNFSRDQSVEDNNNNFGNRGRNNFNNNRDNFDGGNNNNRDFNNRGYRNNNRFNNNQGNNDGDNNQEVQGQNGRKRNFNDRFGDNNNQGFNRDRNNQGFNRDRNNNQDGFNRNQNNNEGFRGRGRGGRGRGRGGFSRDNNNQRNEGSGFNNDNNGEEANKNVESFEDNKPKCDEPDEY